MYRPRSIHRFKLLIALLLIGASAGCGRGIYGPDEEVVVDCREQLETEDGYRPLCPDA